MRGATVNSLQPHQILRLPRKMHVMMDPHHIWNVIYNARSNSQHPPTSPNTAPATQYESHDWSASHMKRHLQCAEQQSTPSNLTKYCACHAIWISWLIRITYETSFTMRGATVNTLQPHQILRLPRNMKLMIDPHHIWNVIYNARSNSPHPPTSPNTAPATQNESHAWSASLMKRHLQCAEQQSTPTQPHQILRLPRKMTIQHLTEIWWKQLKRHLQCATDPRPIRPWSEHDPTMIRAWSDHKLAHRNPPRHRGYFSHSPGADSIENYNVSRSGYHSKFHQMLRLPRKVTHELHQMLRLPRKVTHELHQMLRLPRKVTPELHLLLLLLLLLLLRTAPTATATATATAATTATATATTTCCYCYYCYCYYYY